MQSSHAHGAKIIYRFPAKVFLSYQQFFAGHLQKLTAENTKNTPMTFGLR